MGGADDDSNTYMVTVKAEAGGEMDMVDVTVTVTNEDEEGMCYPDRLNAAQHWYGSPITATLTDSDGDMMVT